MSSFPANLTAAHLDFIFGIHGGTASERAGSDSRFMIPQGPLLLFTAHALGTAA